MQNKLINLATRHAFMLMIAVAFMLIYSSTTSIFHSTYGADSAIFKVVGQTLLNGGQLYVDIWDHKGPGLFLIQWLGQAIYPGRAGILAVQIICLYASIALFESVTRTFLSVKLQIALLFLSLAFYSQVFEQGNLTEEYSILFVILVLWLLLPKSADSRSPMADLKISNLNFLIAGAAFAFVGFIRLNNAIPIAAIFFAFFFFSLLHKTEFIKQLLISVLGFFIVVGIFCIIFWFSGSLHEMLNATFFFNAKYSGNSNASFFDLAGSKYFVLAMGAATVGFLGSIFEHNKNGYSRWFFLSLSITIFSTLSAIITPNLYLHYLQNLLVTLAIGLFLIFKSINRKTALIALLSSLLISLPVLAGMAVREFRAPLLEGTAQYAEAVDDILLQVPKNEVKDIYPWEIRAKIFLITDIEPQHRFFTLQEWWGASDPAILRESLDYVSSKKPLWILTGPNGVNNSELQGLLEIDYELNNQNTHFRLYKFHN